MKFLFYLLVSMLTVALLVNTYSLFFDKGYFWSPLSKAINIGTPALAFIYLLLCYIKEKKKLNELIKRYAKYFSKN